MALLASPVAGQGDPGSDPLTAGQRAWLEAHGPVKVGILTEQPPVSFTQDGRLQGWMVDAWSLMALKLGLDIQFVVAENGDQLVEMLDSGAIDATTFLPPQDRLSRVAVPSGPFGLLPLGFVTVGRPDLRTLDDLSGRVSTIPGPLFAEYVAPAYPHLQYVDVGPALTDGLQALADGRIDLYFGPWPGLGYTARTLGITDMRPVGAPLQETEITTWTVPDEPILRAIVEAGRQSISASEFNIITVKWTGFGLAVPPEPAVVVEETIPSWIWWVAAAVVVVAVTGLAWNRSLRRAVTSATADLKTLNRELEARVQARTTELSAQKRALESSNRSLEQFASVASHDLQAPLRHIRSFTGFLAKSLQGRLTKEESEDMERVQDSVGRLQDQVNGLLSLSRVQGSPMEVEDINLDTLVADVVDSLTPDIQESKATVTYEGLGSIRADPHLMEQVFQNLIVNSIRHRRDEAPRIDITRQDHANGARIKVADNGRGFSEEEAGRLFRIFTRLDPSRPGSGLGLALCKTIIDRHGGTITAHGVPGVGATFTLDIPTEQA